MLTTDIDPKIFRRALGQFPTGVTVITTTDSDKQPVGVTASSFNSVSMDPPLILWSIDKRSFSAKTFETAGYFAVHVLHEEQVAVSNRFASRGDDKFSGIEFSVNEQGCPLLADYAALFICKTWQTYDGGDHIIIVGEVTAYENVESATPLVFSRGSYAVTNQHPAMASDDKNTPSNSEFLHDYLLYLLNGTTTRYQHELYPKLMEKHGITPERWRIMTLLSAGQAQSFTELSELAMQPPEDLQVMLQTLSEQGWVAVADDAVTLTSEGLVQQTALKQTAKQHESGFMNNLSAEEEQLLKTMLRRLQGL
ncbi:flavin reductase [Alteromonas lipolytica]|uniref:Nitrilotriacetate monooxygenase n=1 Tax=Alteromonas lipolytica TaxID=1856405 RepID=A0A1E8FAQ9_9ALTE|nr:flavin reductase [Alteromonas lipolytica]OFI33014.1 nitrilotriacetate monooxygenase [Alteromonas lipolytica]GGF63329.1 flavin oxidoreductase [Alteromonas lipolytica]